MRDDRSVIGRRDGSSALHGDIGRDAGLTKHLSFDMCRWTCALNAFHAGEEPDKIRQNLGVSKIQWREINMKLRQLAGQ